jgi:hypothetical protein
MGICIFGQGDCNSETTTDITNITSNNTEIDNSIRNRINQDCNVAISQSNTANIIGSKVKKLTVSQNNSVQSLCVMRSILKNNISTEVTNKLLDEIKNNVSTTGALLGAPAYNKTIMKNFTDNSTKINNSKFNDITKRCILGLSQDNILNIIGSEVEDSTIDQANKAFLECLSEHSDDTLVTFESLNDTQKKNDNTTTAQGGDLLKSAGEGVGTAAQGVGTGLGTAVQSAGTGVGTAVQSVGSSVGTAATGVGSGVSTAAQGVGSGVSTAAQGVGSGVGTAAQGVGTGVATGAKGVGEGMSAFLSSFTYPIIFGIIGCSIVLIIISFMMMKNPEAVQSLSNIASSTANSFK